MGQWLTTTDLAYLLGLRENSIVQAIRRGRYAHVRQVAGRGNGHGNGCGGKIWQICIDDPAIPEPARQRWLAEHMPEQSAQLPAVSASPKPIILTGHDVATAASRAVAKIETGTALRPGSLDELKSWQRDTMEARLWFMRQVEARSHEFDSLGAAIRAAIMLAKTTYPQMITRANRLGEGEPGNKRAVSERTVRRWYNDYREGGELALAPAGRDSVKVPAWAPYFLQAYQRPQKPSMQQALENMVLPEGLEYPSIQQVRRFCQGMSRVDLQRGRMSAAQLKSIMPFKRRDTGDLWPGDIYQIDGHSFKARVAHPKHGGAFKPEVCGVIDMATKLCVGWSTGLAESNETVAQAVIHAGRITPDKPYGCIPAILYSDNGAGNLAARNADRIVGLFARLGITHETGRAGNPQGRGGVERMQASLWIRAAKDLPTYVGRDMDPGAQRKIDLALAKELRQAKKTGQAVMKSDLLLSWPQFLDFCADAVDKYNRRPHSALPKITDPETGLRRHMSPLEMWAVYMYQGWEPTVIEDYELNDLGRPYERVKCSRGEVRVLGGIYYHHDLAHRHGMELKAGYDIHDSSRVWVRDLDESLICVAELNANKTPFMPATKVERATQQRHQNRLAAVERKRDEIELEAGALVPEWEPVDSFDVPEEVLEKQRQLIDQAAQQGAPRPLEDEYNDYIDDPLKAFLKLQEEFKAGLPLTPEEIEWMEGFDLWRHTGKKTGNFAKGFNPFLERQRRARVKN